MDRATVDIYERSASAYDAARDPRRLDEARQFDRRCERGDVRLDVGSGAGRYTAALGRPVVALDAAGAMLELTRAHAPSAMCVQGDVERLPFRRSAAGGAWASMTYHHLPRARLPLALAELHWALRVDAPVDLTAVHGDYEGTALRDDDFPGRYFACWDVEFATDIVTGAGFDVGSVAVEGPNVHVQAARARTLPDTVGPGMRILMCGLNPSLYAADAGVGFARPNNRFWRAAIAAGVVSRPRDPRRALVADGVGITDLVKRATVGSSELRPDEYRAGVARVERLVRWLQPRVVCFVGLEGWRLAMDRKAVAGPVEGRFAGAAAYLMPSTSGLNAHARFDDLVEHFRAVSRLAAPYGEAPPRGDVAAPPTSAGGPPPRARARRRS